jgi:hypothetical protein
MSETKEQIITIVLFILVVIALLIILYSFSYSLGFTKPLGNKVTDTFSASKGGVNYSSEVETSDNTTIQIVGISSAILKACIGLGILIFAIAYLIKIIKK